MNSRRSGNPDLSIINLEKPEEFGAIGAAFDKAHNITINKISTAEVRFFKQRLMIDFAVEWLEQNRDLTDWSQLKCPTIPGALGKKKKATARIA